MSLDIFSKERWKYIIVDEVETIFQISDFGRLRRLNVEANTWSFIVSKPCSTNNNFIFYRIPLAGIKKSYSDSAHRLVAKYFLAPPADNQIYVIHKDYNNSNNYFVNLAWATKQELEWHRKINPSKVGRKKPLTNNKLTETEVMRLKLKLKRSKMPLYKIAREFGITHTQLNRIRSGENWGHVEI